MRKEQKPKHWEKRVAAAYLRMQGMTQQETGAAIGRSRRTIYEWEQDISAWEMARGEARALWMNEAEDAARRAVHNSIKAGNAELAWRFLERIDPRLEPRQKHELSGPRGGPIPLPAVAVVGPLPRAPARQADKKIP